MCSILLFCSSVRPKELTYVPEQLKTWLFLSLVFNAGACISKPHLISLLEHGKEPWEAEGEGTRSTLQGENVRCRWKNLSRQWLGHLQKSFPPHWASQKSFLSLKALAVNWFPFSFHLVSVVSCFVQRRLS